MAIEFYDDSTERTVLSALLNDITFLEDSLSKNKIYLEDFYMELNRSLYDIILKFFVKYHSLLPQQALEKFLIKNAIVKKTELTVLYAEVKALTNAQGPVLRMYVEQLKDYTTKRRLYAEIFKPLQEGLQDESSSGSDLHNQITRTILSTPSTDSAVRISSVYARPDARIDSYFDRKNHPEKYTMLKYGMKEVDDATGGMQKQALYMVYGRTGAGKCVAADTLVVLSDGSRVKIKDIVDSQTGKILTLTDAHKLKLAAPTAFMCSGKQRVYKVLTNSGREIVLTKTHPLLTIHGWKPVQDLSIGDRIAVPREIPVFGRSTMSIPRVKLMAYLIAEGGCCSNELTFTNNDKIIQKDFVSAVKKSTFENTRVVTYGKKGSLSIIGSTLSEEKREYKPGCYRRMHSHVVKAWLKGLNLNKKSVDKTLPTEVFQFSKKQLATFLATLWACDGSIYGPTFDHITYETGSPELTKQVAHLLLRFGILTRYWEHYITFNNKKFVVGSLEVLGSSRKTFLKEVGKYIIGEKQSRVKQALKCFELYQQNTNLDTLPMNLIYPYLPKTVEGKIDRTTIDQKCKFEINYSTNWDIRGCSREKTLRLAEALKNKTLTQLATSDIFWDTVRDIQYVGVQDTYDLEMAPTHNFVANDIIIHNSRMMFNIGCNVAKTGASVLYFTIEMPGEAIQHMWESRELHIPLNKITKTPPTLDPDEEKRYVEFLQDMKIHKAPFHIVDIASGATTGLIAAEVMKFEKKYGRMPDIVLADYASLIMPMGKHKDRVEKYDHLFREMKELARSHDTIYYTAAQANRDVLKSAKAGTEHVAFSDAASHHCDGVFYIHASEEDEIASQVQFSGVKDRWNQTKTVTLHWNRETNYIGNWGSIKSGASVPPPSEETQTDEF